MSNPNGLSGAENKVLEVLRFTKQRLKLIHLGAGLMTWVLAILTCLLAFVMADHLVRDGVPPAIGWLARTVVLLLSAIWLTICCIRPLLRHMSDLYAAWLIERAHPEFKNSVVGAVQLGHRPELPGSMRDALERRAALDLVGVDVAACVSSRPLNRVLKMSGAVTAVFLLYALFSPKQVFPSIQRAFGFDVPAPTLTRIVEMFPEEGASVVRGEPVEFTVRLSGRTPDEALVRFSLDEGITWLDGQQLALSVRGEDADQPRPKWRGIKAGMDVQQTMWWQVLAGDARSPVQRLEVRPQPQVVGVSTWYEYPRYTGLAPTSQPAGDIQAPVGTRVTVRADTNVPAFDPVLVIGQPPRDRRQLLDAPTARNPRRIEAELTVREDSSYLINFRDAHRTPSPSPIRYRIQARADGPPAVEVKLPATGLELLPEDHLPLELSAEDDYGVSRAALLYRGAGSRQEERIELGVPGGKRTLNCQQSIPVDELGGSAGDVIEWRVRVWDNREAEDGSPSPQFTDSDIRTVHIRAVPGAPQPPGLLAEGTVRNTPVSAGNAEGAQAGEPTDASDAGAGDPAAMDNALAAADPSEQEPPPEPQAAEPAPDNEASEKEEAEEQPRDLDSFAQEHARELEVLAQHMEAEQPAGEQEESNNDDDESPLPGDPGAATQQQTEAAAKTPGGKDEAGDQPQAKPAAKGDSQENAQTEGQEAASSGQEARAATSAPSPAGSGNPRDQTDNKTAGDSAKGEGGERQTASQPEQDGSPGSENPGADADRGDDPAEPSEQERGADSRPAGDGQRRLELPREQTDDRPSEAAALPGSDRTENSTFESPEEGTAENEAGEDAPGASTEQGLPQNASEAAPPDESSAEESPGEASQPGPNPGNSAAPQASAQAAAAASETEATPPAAPEQKAPAQTPAPGEQPGQSEQPGPPGEQPGQSEQPGPPGEQPGQSEQPGPPGNQPGQGPSPASGDMPDGPGGPGTDESPAQSPPEGSQGQGSGSQAQESGDDPPGDGESDAAKGEESGASDTSGSGKSPTQASGEQGEGSQSGSGQPSDSSGEPPSGEAASSSGNLSENAGAGSGGGAINRTGPTAEVPDQPAPATVEPTKPDPPRDQPAPEGPGLRIKALVNQLDMSLRRGEVDETLLSELGWDVARAEQFVKDFKRAEAQGQAQSERSKVPTQQEAVLRGPKVEQAVRAERASTGRGLNAQQDRPADSTRRLLGVGRQKVTPRYQGLLEAYYQSMTTQPAR